MSGAPIPSRPVRRGWLSLERLGWAALAAAVLFLGYVVASPGVAFQDAEVVVNFLPAAITNGTAPSLDDLMLGFDTWSLDGDSRPRVVSYLTFILIEKVRLALWNLMPLTPSFSPLWLLTVGMGPWLLYKALRNFSMGKGAALLGTAVYLTSTGMLSGVAMLFHPAKPLANVLLIAVLYLLSRDRAPAAPPPGVPRFSPVMLWGVLPVLAVGLLCDETAFFLLLVPPLFRPDYFVPRPGRPGGIAPWILNLLAYAAPLACFAGVAFVLMPAMSGANLSPEGHHFDFGSYLERLFVARKIGAVHFFYVLSTLLETSLVPWGLTGRSAPLNPAALHGIDFVALAAFAGLVAAVDRRIRDGARRALFRRLALLIVVFAAFEMAVVSFHPLDLVVSSFYYGALFAVLFAALMGVAFETLGRPDGGGRLLVAGLAVLVLAVQASSFLSVDRRWQVGNDIKAFNMRHMAAGYGAWGDWSRIIETPESQMLAGLAHPDAVGHRQNSWRTIVRLWCRWKTRDPHWLDGQVVTFDRLWIVSELLAESRVPPWGKAYVTPFLNLNRESTSNLSGIEIGPDAKPFRWGLGPETRVYFSGWERPMSLRFALVNQIGLPQRVTVSVNGIVLLSAEVKPGQRLEQKVDFRAKTGSNEIVFSYSEWSHRTDTASSDPRFLAVVFRKLIVSGR